MPEAAVTQDKQVDSRLEQAKEVLHRVFGFEAFRPQQREVVRAVLAGEDALVLMPTGGGKSLCYQIPAIVRPGVGVVISPLIALMHDQVDALNQLGVRAAFLNSTQDLEESLDIENALLKGELDLLYCAPERLLQPRMLDLLKGAGISLFAIDEAHCVSQWGHDFREDYLGLDVLEREFSAVPRVALTATADERTRHEVAERLHLNQARWFISGFDRPNIQYRIGQKNNAAQQLIRFIESEHPGESGIVYCLSRNRVESLAEKLCKAGMTALPYHAGLPSATRSEHQRRFLREDGVIIVATIAFGMGIDKPDVRYVAHLDLPKSIEAYYQETGRAGRDGQPATAWMVYGLQDVIKLRQMLDTSPGNQHFKRLERQKLDAMMGLCEVVDCRRKTLLSYFGDKPEDACGNCDTCLAPPETWDGTVAVQKALSCVYRTGQRYGVGYIIDVLRGTAKDRIVEQGHDRISTFGIGQELSVTEWKSVFRQLVARGYLQTDPDGFGVLSLTESCRPLLRGESRIDLRKDVVRDASRKRSGSNRGEKPTVTDQPGWEHLRACRKALAEDQGVPPYMIFHDATLLEMLERKPASIDELRAINGVGQAKLERYGQQFLEALKSLPGS